MSFLFWLFNPYIYELIQRYKVTQDSQMPLAYRNIPGGRPLHNDWLLFKSTPRMDTAFRCPLPMKVTKGKSTKQYTLWDTSYPSSPDLVTQSLPYTTVNGTTDRVQAYIDVAGDGWSISSAYLSGEWRPVFLNYRRNTWFGRQLAFDYGLRQDVTVTPNADGTVRSDIMCWFPEISLTWNKV